MGVKLYLLKTVVNYLKQDSSYVAPQLKNIASEDPCITLDGEAEQTPESVNPANRVNRLWLSMCEDSLAGDGQKTAYNPHSNYGNLLELTKVKRNRRSW